MYTEAPWLCATPYHHKDMIKKPKIKDFVVVSVK